MFDRICLVVPHLGVGGEYGVFQLDVDISRHYRRAFVAHPGRVCVWTGVEEEVAGQF